MKPNSLFKGKYTKKALFAIMPVILCAIIVCVLVVSLNDRNAQAEKGAGGENPDILSSERGDEEDMEKLYERINFENAPSTKTPLNEETLNKMDSAIDEMDNRIVKLQNEIDANDVISHENSLPPNATIRENTYFVGGSFSTLKGYTTIEVPIETNGVCFVHIPSREDWAGLDAYYVVQGRKTNNTVEHLDNEIPLALSNTGWGGFLIVNHNLYSLQSVVVCVKTECVKNITIINSSNHGIHNELIDVSKLPVECLTTADLPLATNIIKGSMFMGSCGIARIGGAEDHQLRPYYGNGAIRSYGLVPVKRGQTLSLVYDVALSTIGVYIYGDFTSYEAIHKTNHPSTFIVPEDGYLYAMESTIEGQKTNVSVKDESKAGMIPKYLIEGDGSSLHGKKWTSFGDSITAQEKWQGYVVNDLGLVHTNCGIGSTCLSGTGENVFWQDVRLDAVKASNPDIVTILGGANDLVLNPVIGTEAELTKALSEKDKNTFIGAYSYIIESLLAWKPSLEIMILGTTWAHNDGANYSDTVTYTDYSEACRKVASYYGLPFVDLHGNAGFNAFTMGNAPYNIYSSDCIHPNEAGGKKIASLVIAKMKEVYNE